VSRSEDGDLVSVPGDAAVAVTLDVADWSSEEERSQEADQHLPLE
jgi:hypothetical protein